MIHNIPQPQFEAFIADLLKDDPNVTIKKGVAFESCEQVSFWGTQHLVTQVQPSLETCLLIDKL